MARVVLPPFTRFGVLPPGEYEATLDELRRSHVVVGPKDGRPWDTTWRLRLLAALQGRLGQLWAVGYVPQVVIAGSFVEDVPHPADIDGWFPCPRNKCGLDCGEPQDLQRDLNHLDPRRLWSWRRQEANGRRKFPMWHALRVELYYDAPGVFIASDARGRGLRPSEFFSRTRSGRPKGVVRIRDPNRS